MSEPDDNSTPENAPDNIENEQPSAEDKASEKEAEPTENVDAGVAGQDAEEEAGEADQSEAEDAGDKPEAEPEKTDSPQLHMSDELQKALEEAEALVEKKEQEKKPAATDGEEAEAEEFDPNRVDEVEEEVVVEPPTPRELELKMEVVKLRQTVRSHELEIEQKIKELKQNLEQARHIQTQFDGYKARVLREKADQFNYGHEPILKELLPVIDNLERALAHSFDDSDSQGLREGVELIVRQLIGVLEKFGVSRIEALGEPFNPEFHQAMSQIEDDQAPNNTVLEVHQTGYLLKDRLLRPAMVSVSKSSRPEKEPAEDSEEGGAQEPDQSSAPEDEVPRDENGE